MGIAAVAIVAVPYATTTLPFRTALLVQASALLVVTLAVLTIGLGSGWWRRIVTAPRPLLVGIALYGAAALQGGIVALARGNHADLVAGQVLSMGLLPLAAVAGLGLRGGKGWRGLTFGLVGAVAAAAALHLGLGAWYLAHGQLFDRLVLPNGVYPADVSLLAVALALPLTRSPRTAAPRLAWLALAITLVYVLGSQIRSLWLAIVVTGLAFLAATRTHAVLLKPRFWLAAASAALVLIAAGVAFTHWTKPSHPGSAVMLLRQQVEGVAHRAKELLPGGKEPGGLDDPYDFRVKESVHLLNVYADSGWREKLLGKGLGATYELPGLGRLSRRPDDAEHDRSFGVDEVNYVHNFYVFLVFKLGIVGTAGVLAALGFWIAWTVRESAAVRDGLQGGFLGAAVAVWLGVCVWSLACPEILDFRVAPLWGFLLAASANAVSEDVRGRT